MPQLTETLNDPNFTPRVSGGAGRSNMIGGFAELGAGLIQSLDQAQRRKATLARQDNPALDEFASGAATILSGEPINPRAQKILAQAEHYQKANDSGNMSSTSFDLAMKRWYADVMQRYPDQAEEIFKMGAEKGLDHYYFREARVANQVAENNVTSTLEMENQALKYGMEHGVYHPGMSRPQALARSYDLMFQDAVDEGKKKQQEELIRNAQISEPWWKDKVTQLDAEIVQGTMTKVHGFINYGLEQIYNLYSTAAGNPDRLQMIDHNYSAALLDLDKLDRNIREALNAGGRNVVRRDEKGAIAETRFVPIPKEAYEQASAEIKAAKETITYLQKLPGDEAKRFLETQVVNNQTAARELIPNIMAMKDSLGMTIPAILDTLTISPGKFGLTPTQASFVLAEIGQGSKKFSEDSFQFIQAMTNQGNSPALKGEGDQANKAYVQNLNVGWNMGNLLMNGRVASEQDRGAILKNFENSWAAVIAATRTRYNASNIDLNRAQIASNWFLNPKFVASLDAYVKEGGNKDIAQMMGAQSAIAAGTMVEALKQERGPGDSELVQYNKLTGKFDALAVPASTAFGYATPNSAFNLDSAARVPSKQGKDLASELNSLLDYIDTVHQQYPVLLDEHLKNSKVSIRDVAAGDGLEAYGQSVQAQIDEQKALTRKEQQLFEQGSQNFDFYKDNSFALDNSSTGDGGFTSSYSGKYNLNPSVPEDYVKLIDDAASANGLDPALFGAVIGHESGFNPKARGPSIPKYRGTEDEFAIGLGQLLPSTAREMGVKDINDPVQNLNGAAKYLKQNLDQFNGDAVLALMAYNWGPENVNRWLSSGQKVSKIPRQTLEYVKSILKVDLLKEANAQ